MSKYKDEDQKLTYEEIPKMRWRNNKAFKIHDGLIVPEEDGDYSTYEPFALYEKEEQKYSGSPHQIFSNIDTSDNRSIESFYKDFGPLGFYDRDVIKLVQHISRSSEGSQIVAKVRDSMNRSNNFKQLSLDDLKSKYHIANNKFENVTTKDVLPQAPTIKCIDTSESIKDFFKHDHHDVDGDKEILDPAIILHEIHDIDSFDTCEYLEDFKEAHEKFTWVMNLNSNLEHRNANKLKELLLSDNTYIEYDLQKANDERIFSEASKYISYNINIQLNETVSVALSMHDSQKKLSRNIVWRCKSLITAMWLMLLLDITKSKFNAKCPECGKWFYAERSHGIYCGTNHNICKYRANKRNQKYKAEFLKKDTVINLLRKEISIQEICKSEGIRKKTIQKWINEDVEV